MLNAAQPIATGLLQVDHGYAFMIRKDSESSVNKFDILSTPAHPTNRVVGNFFCIYIVCRSIRTLVKLTFCNFFRLLI